MHVTDTIEPSANYNKRLIEDASDVSPAGKLDAAIPIDPRVNMIVSEKDGVSYFTGCDTGTPCTVLDVIDSTAGHEATAHAVYTETYAAARRVFASLLESQCLIETFVDIYYQGDSEFVQFEPVEIGGRSNHYQTPSVVGLFVSRYTATTGCGEQNEGTDSDTDSVSSSEISQDTLLAYFSHWLNNYTCKSLSDTPSPETMLSSVDGLERVSRGDNQGDSQYYWQLDEGVWNFE